MGKKSKSVLQIRRGNRDNLGIIIHISSFKYILNRLVETVLMRGSTCESRRNKKIHLSIILNTPTYLELWANAAWSKKQSLEVYAYTLTLKVPKIKIVDFANSVDPDEVARENEPPHLDLHCLSSSL